MEGTLTVISWLCVIGLGGICIYQRLKILDYEEKDKKREKWMERK